MSSYTTVERDFYDSFLESIPFINALLHRPGESKQAFQRGERDCRIPRNPFYYLMNGLTILFVCMHLATYVYSVQWYGRRAFCADLTSYPVKTKAYRRLR